MSRDGGLLTHALRLVKGREVALLLLLGAILRFLWLAQRGSLGFAQGEAANVAISLARDGAFADAFGRGSGLTAHFTPSMILLTGGVYRLFGIRTFASELVLSCISIGLSLGSGFLWYLIVRRIGVPRLHAVIALALFCVLPLDFNNEAIGFRAWEGGLAVLFAAWSLLLILSLDERDHFIPYRYLAAALIVAATFYINQAIGLAAFSCLGLLVLRRCAVRQWPAAIGLAALCLAAVLAPWTIRNYLAFDRIIPLRSNLGLELAIANHPGAASADDERRVFVERLREIHPLENQQAFERMVKGGGEVAYAEALGRQAKNWIASHPSDFAALALTHLREFYFPPSWQWNVYSSTARGVEARRIMVWAITAVGLLGVMLLPLIYGPKALYLSIFAVLPSLPYVIVQPILRYRYLVSTPLLFFGCCLILWLVALMASSRGRQLRIRSIQH